MMGSKEKITTLYTHLLADGFTQEQLDNVYSPNRHRHQKRIGSGNRQSAWQAQTHQRKKTKPHDFDPRKRFRF